jgi:predicted Zn-dependent peptidase
MKGDRDNVHAIKQDHVREFHSANYYGDNLVVVGVGNINHEEFVSQVNTHF